MPKSIVAISKGDDPEKMVAEVFSLLGGVENLVKPRSTVVLKPNAGHPAAAETSVNTSPEFVAAVIKEVQKAKPKEVIVAEAAAIGCDSLHVFEVSGIGAAAEAAGARLVDIKGRRSHQHPSGTPARISRRSNCPAFSWKPSTSSTYLSSRATPVWFLRAHSRT
jgi:uncharacterized protein (DUF362 family)